MAFTPVAEPSAASGANRRFGGSFDRWTEESGALKSMQRPARLVRSRGSVGSRVDNVN